jgi:hypothetical protein
MEFSLQRMGGIRPGRRVSPDGECGESRLAAFAAGRVVDGWLPILTVTCSTVTFDCRC